MIQELKDIVRTQMPGKNVQDIRDIKLQAIKIKRYRDTSTIVVWLQDFHGEYVQFLCDNGKLTQFSNVSQLFTSIYFD